MTAEIVKTVFAADFIELGSVLTPRLHLVVDYTRGGKSFITGEHYAKGYQISIRHDRIDQEGSRSMVIDGKGHPTACIQKADRFSQKTLDNLVNEVRSGKYDSLIADLYANAKANASQHVWPETIFPLADLHSVVDSVVSGSA